LSIRFENVTKTFGEKKVLTNISFEISEGEIVFIIGKSGVGKSVTLKQIVGLLKPDSGHIYVDNQDVTSLRKRDLPSIRQKCGMVFQHPALLDSLSIYENVSFGLRTPQYINQNPDALSEDHIRNVVINALSLVNLGADILHKFPNEISYGMQKRVSLARTIAPKPKFLLFDEPTTGSDPITINAINDLILDLSRKLNVTSVVVSHDMGCALKIADRILVLDQSQILFFGTVTEIQNSEEPLIREFLAESYPCSERTINK